MKFIEFILNRKDEFLNLSIQHLKIATLAVLLAIIVAVPLGILISKNEKVAKKVLMFTGLLQTIPSLAFFGFIIPILGIGVYPAIFVLFLYGLLPILTNTYIGIKSIDKSVLEAATGIGMNSFQILTKVELPLSFPIIMGGIKISTVTNIGTTTIASLIGAGGLGDAIFRGISTNNNYLILGGAIPTALMAIVANLILGNLEKAITPIEESKDKIKKLKAVKIAKISLISFSLIFGLIIYKNMKIFTKPTIKIAHKNYTEQRILGQLYKVLLENKLNYNIEVIELGGSLLTFEALKNGIIDMYPEYTGTIYSAVLKERGESNPEVVYDYVKKEIEDRYQLTLLGKLNFSNTYAFIMKPELVKKYGINAIVDMVPYGDTLVLGSTSEFYEREDGLIGLERVYNLFFQNKVNMDVGLMFKAVTTDKIHVGVAFSTDGGIKKYGLKVIKDSKNFFPPYNVAPMVSKKFKEKNPEIIEAMDSFRGIITEEEMQNMNYLASELGENEAVIAKKFLKEKGIISED